ncbi:MAG: DUF1905 domain-containing protein [Hamadaea sp.]|nr:DUF1905 domain-containing protein [Hamadaea sp.]
MVAEDGGRGRLRVPIPFDPDEAWHPKPRHHVTGTVNGCKIRGVIETTDGRRGLLLGASWSRDNPVRPGDRVTVHVTPEGPQRGDLPDDLAAALDADPRAAAFWDGLAQFYRKAYLRWIAGATRRPQQRAERIVEVVGLLAAGVKQRPQA